ncbi:Disease resistance protein [Nymphaea thermarum]|nr:Disease resistance protein [Nymphaea thermarum]
MKKKKGFNIQEEASGAGAHRPAGSCCPLAACPVGPCPSPSPVRPFGLLPLSNFVYLGANRTMGGRLFLNFLELVSFECEIRSISGVGVGNTVSKDSTQACVKLYFTLSFLGLVWAPAHTCPTLAPLLLGTPKVEGIIVDFEKAKDCYVLTMLRLLRANYANIIGDFNISLENLNGWNGKVFGKLKVLNLSGCNHLTITPDFSVVPCLVKLILDNCISLVEVHKSIGHLKEGLVLLRMVGCKKLMELPNELCQLTSLRKLILSYCSKLCSLPNQLGDLMSLTTLAVRCTLLTKLPNSLGKLSILENLLLDNCYQLKDLPSSIGHLSKLKILDIGYCTSLATLPNSIGDATNLKNLVLDATALEELPDTIGLLRKLEILSLSGCKMLKILPSSMGKMRELHHLNITESQIRELPEDFGCMSKLSVLRIGQNATLGSLPTSFSQLTSLAELDVDLHNVSVEKIPENFGNLSSLQSLTLFNSKHASLSVGQLPSSLTKLHAFKCSSLEKMSDASNLVNLRELFLADCVNFIDVHGLEMLKSLRFLDMNGCVTVCAGLKDKLVKVVYCRNANHEEEEEKRNTRCT